MTPVNDVSKIVTLHVAVLPPALAVIVTSPSFTPVTTPLPLTVAIDVLLEDQVTDLFVALSGFTVAVIVPVLPGAIVMLLLFRLTPVTATSLTVTLQVAVLPPTAVFAVMVAVPAFTPFTTPELLTVATAVLLELHVTLLLGAEDGDTVAVRVDEAPVFNAIVDLFKLTPVTAFGSVTDTVFDLLAPVIGSFMETFAAPEFTAVIVPAFEFTVTVFVLLDVHVGTPCTLAAG